MKKRDDQLLHFKSRVAGKSDKQLLHFDNRMAGKRVDQMIHFDSGAAVHFDEALHNSLTLGSTGSGKTSSVMLPACNALFKAGFSGLIIDIKGNFTSEVRTLARFHGREHDIVEFGTSTTAKPLNILDGLSITEVYNLLRKLTVLFCNMDSSNSYWYLQGIQMVTDALQLLRFIAADHEAISPDMVSLGEIANDYILAREMYDYFKEHIYNKKNKEHLRLVKRIDSDFFHLCGYNAKKMEDYEYPQQISWRLGTVWTALEHFMQVPELTQNFAAVAGCGLNMKELIYDQKKIVILAFNQSAGLVNRVISRHLIEAYYMAVFANGLDLPSGQYTFFIADEFQDCMDLNSENRFNDNVFAAKTREFNSIQLVALQSMAAPISRGVTPLSLDEFINNCNNRIFFYCDDPLTQSLASRFRFSAYLPELKQGQCLAMRYDIASRRHISSLENLQKSHDVMYRVLAKDGNVKRQANITMTTEREYLDEIFEVIAASRVRKKKVSKKKAAPDT